MDEVSFDEAPEVLYMGYTKRLRVLEEDLFVRHCELEEYNAVLVVAAEIDRQNALDMIETTKRHIAYTQARIAVIKNLRAKLPVSAGEELSDQQ